LASLMKPNRQTMIRLLIYGGLIALFACTSKPGIEEPTTISSLPDSTINTSFASDCTRVDSQAVTKILKEQKLKRASNPKAQSDITKNIPNRVTIKAILKEFDTKPLQEHKITGSCDTTIRLQEGTIIKIPSNAFIIKNTGQKPKGKVRLMVKEYYSLSDILFANLTTTTKTEIVETGGMIYINACAGTDTLALEKEVEIRFPFKDEIEGMQLFTGQRDTSSIMIWESFTEELESATDYENSFYAIAEEMPSFPGGYENFISFLRKNIKYPSDARRKGLEGTVYVNIVINANGEVREKRILKGLNESLNQAALNAFNNMPAWEPGKVAGKNVNVKMVFPVNFRLDGISFTSSSQPRTTYNDDLRRDFEENLSDSVLQKANANVVSHYILSSSKLGWINCDRFITKTPQTRFKVFVGEGNNSDVKIIFENYKSVLPGYYVDGYYQFDNVPVGEPVTIIAIRAKNDNLMLAINKTIINNSIYSALNFKQVTVETLKEEMQKIKQ
jgi:TonB family protein